MFPNGSSSTISRSEGADQDSPPSSDTAKPRSAMLAVGPSSPYNKKSRRSLGNAGETTSSRSGRAEGTSNDFQLAPPSSLRASPLSETTNAVSLSAEPGENTNWGLSATDNPRAGSHVDPRSSDQNRL